MKMKIEEISRASTGDTIELEGKVIRYNNPNDNEYGWSQRIILKDDTGEQGCWLNLDGEEDKVTKGTPIKINGKLSEEYTEKRTGKLKRSINGCQFEVIGKVQALAQKSTQPTQEKVDDKVWKDKDLRTARESALKNIAKYVVAKIVKLEDRFKYAQEDVDFIYKDMIEDMVDKYVKDSVKEFGRKTKEERTKKAKEIVGETEFKPASTKQKNIIFGYTDKEGYHKGMIDSRYIETEEIKKIGDPKKLSVEEANAWIEFWWGEQGNPEDIGARKQREQDNPRNENGKPVKALVKGDKTSIAKEVLVDDIYALRREHRLNDDIKFKKLMGYNPKIEELTEAELTKLKGILKRYIPF